MVTSLINDYGYIALLIILFLDSSGVPWPTEATLVLAGGAAHAGNMNVLVAALVSLIGAGLGSSLSWYLGRRMGPALLQKIGAFFRLSPQHLEKVDMWFDKHGHRAVFFGRLVPFVRNLIGYPAGVMEIPFRKYLLFSLAGYTLYIAFALTLGYGGVWIARVLGDLELVLWIAIPLGLAVAYWKWGRKYFPIGRKPG